MSKNTVTGPAERDFETIDADSLMHVTGGGADDPDASKDDDLPPPQKDPLFRN
jgi:hypothetical protein